MTHFRNLKTYLESGYLFAKNYHTAQAGYRISYDEIVHRRGTAQFTTPCNSNVNDFVPFYFSPSTAMAFAIHIGNVRLKASNDIDLGVATMEDVAYFVVEPRALFESGRQCWFTDIACNSGFPPAYKDEQAELESHIDWALFDDSPKMGVIREIDYMGVCQWFHDRDLPVEHQMRSTKRMAEFMVKNYLQMSEVSCIVLKSETHLEEVQTWVNLSGIQIPVYVKPGCYF